MDAVGITSTAATSGSDAAVMIGLIIGITSLAIALIVSIVSIAVFWNRMSTILGIVSTDMKQAKKELYQHSEESRLFKETIVNWAKSLDERFNYHKEQATAQIVKLDQISSNITMQAGVLNYMEKIFEEFKQLISTNTEVIKDFKRIWESWERTYGKQN